MLGEEVGIEVWNETQSLLNPNNINGTGEDDELTGTTENDFIGARAGDDLINAGDGNDSIIARRGDDIIDGGAGRDIIAAQRGDDLITGRPGSDFFDFSRNYGNNTIADFEDGIDLIYYTIISIFFQRSLIVFGGLERAFVVIQSFSYE
ncbi:MAG: hypothetical protein F6K22_39965 [Okeania sp. SIO2F4]|uniref:calcium-binding protein n=1 Tax=Okeania sp. SIO2F4 TaxID=2607790 RepID=UPI00142A0F69|nr:hypothetical protein [Okeania sp. SIO2F4]NES08385.1 hypothetical protein [Okeania sp. SIO2F4]